MIDTALEKFLADRRAEEEPRVKKAEKDLEDALKKTPESDRKIADKRKKLATAKRRLENCSNWKNWLDYTAKQAPQLKITTHPCTFSHPSADRGVNVTPVVANCPQSEDGLLRSGNFVISDASDVDAYGNAAALPAFAFLQVHLQSDGKSLLQHLEEDTDQARQLLNEAGDRAEEIRSLFLSALGNPDAQPESSSRVKQVYFPVGNGQYHLLSILTSAVGIHEMKNRIVKRRWEESEPLRVR